MIVLFVYCIMIGDTQVVTFMHHIRNPFLDAFFKGITQFGDVFVIAFVLIGICVWRFKMGFKMGFLCLIGISFNTILKNIFQRERPLGLHLVEENTYSFPSGHSMMSMFFYGMLFLLVREYIKDEKLKKILNFMLLGVILCVGISRMYLNVHYASDVLGGFLVGILCLYVIEQNHLLIK